MRNRITAADLRAEVARLGLPAYVVATRAGMNSVSFSYLLREHRPLRPDHVERIMAAIEELRKEAAMAS